MPAKLPVKQAASNAQGHAHDVRDPVVYVGAPVEAGLYDFNDPAEGTRAYKDRKQAKAPRAGQREGECCEGDEVYQLVAALRRRGRRLQGPEHRDGQGERHNNGEENVEVLAHPSGCIWGDAQRQAGAAGEHIRGEVESSARFEAWGFR